MDVALLTAVGTLCVLKLGNAAPSFSYHAIEPSRLNDVESTSKSPSPSTSVAYTDQVPIAESATTWALKLAAAAPSFSYQAIVLSNQDAESTSISPSPSISAAYTECAPFAAAVTICSLKLGTAAPSFSYQTMLSSNQEADNTSISPSPSISVEVTKTAPSALVEIFLTKPMSSGVFQLGA